MCNDNNPAMKKAVLTRMAYERTESYISAAQTILHLHQDEAFHNTLAFENLRHVLGLMSQEINALGDRLDHEMDNMMESTPQGNIEDVKEIHA